MAFKKYNSANNAVAQLNLPIANTDTTCVLKGKYSRFPTSNFIIKITKTSGGVVTARENIYVATRSGATCTGLVRAYEPVPIDDNATSNIQQALNFSADDVVEVVISSELLKDIQEEVDTKLAKIGGLRTGFGSNKTVYVDPTTGNEVVKDTSLSSIVGTDIIVGRATDGSEHRMTYSAIKTDIGNSISIARLDFGDGSDGDVTISGTVTMTRDMYYNNLTINTGAILKPNGFRIFVKNTLTRNGTGKISVAGGNGGNGVDAVFNGSATAGGTAGVATPAGTLAGGTAGVAGASGSGNNGIAGNPGVSTSYALLLGVAGGSTPTGGFYNGASAGSAGTNTGTVINQFKSYIDMFLCFDGYGANKALVSSGAGSGASGAGANGAGTYSATGGGGSGASGGFMLVFAKIIVANNTNVLFEANGGNGGNGGNGNVAYQTSANGCTGGGGGGGTGGVVFIIHMTSDQTLSAISNIVGGTGGTGGLYGYSQGNAGSNGTTGILKTIQLS